jgi:hypothetical protein
VPDVVDPSPIIVEKLNALAAEHEPRLEELDEAIANANRKDARRLKQERRREGARTAAPAKRYRDSRALASFGRSRDSAELTPVLVNVSRRGLRWPFGR